VESSDTRAGLVLEAARIAEDLLAGCTPSESDIFALAARVLAANRDSNVGACQLALELATGLLEHVPNGPGWNETRGRIWAIRLFAWFGQQALGEPA
jgi:hypothetical protein